MKKLILIACLLIYSNGWAYNETNLLKLKAINVCQGCDLSGINLRDTNLSGADLSDADLSGANLRDAKYCKTKMPSGELNDDCEE